MIELQSQTFDQLRMVLIAAANIYGWVFTNAKTDNVSMELTKWKVSNGPSLGNWCFVAVMIQHISMLTWRNAARETKQWATRFGMESDVSGPNALPLGWKLKMTSNWLFCCTALSKKMKIKILCFFLTSFIICTHKCFNSFYSFVGSWYFLWLFLFISCLCKDATQLKTTEPLEWKENKTEEVVFAW